MPGRFDRMVLIRALGDKVVRIALIHTSSLSQLWRLDCLEGTYAIKATLGRAPVEHEFRNHRILYEIWEGHRSDLDFTIARPLFLGPDRSYYAMDFVPAARNLRQVIASPDDYGSPVELFESAGAAVRQYHELVTECLPQETDPLEEHVYFGRILQRESLRSLYEDFPADTYRTLFKDLTPSNILVTPEQGVYLVDFQKINFEGPFYYDLARFVDTSRLFAFLQNPRLYLAHRREISELLGSFVQGYDPETDPELLREMQLLQRREHVLAKLAEDRGKGLVMKFIYSFLRR